MKQPHEDVAGVDRTDWLLSLDDNAATHRSIIRAQAYQTWGAVMVGNPAPATEDVYKRISDPRVGDLVLVVDSLMRRGQPDARGLGVLVESRDEWWDTDDDWEKVKGEYGDDPRPVDHAYYVQYGSAAADVCRWTNCRLIAVLTDPHDVQTSFTAST